ncbi:DUF4345 family protein [Jannaschia aquimarina]|uniref:DUF4345 domain-containing protein n=1 Tax=Jannaschia aquimarina TaxID=935700 RepID=A0A0D1EE39_9RHOB|nr:DUF4345 family protein [Jannaschia aquimarina]KIT15954.1 hypothetical protein jaqu_22230 [Jannaschia aquimarina]SNS98602.1 protein of unknown function [Jannaschia aquimarina]
MDLASILNVLLALATIGFGAAGWLAPRWTMEKVSLSDTGSTMGLSEVRAASGALFVVAGLGALLMGSPTAYAMLGFIWLGGAVGRATSLLLDGTTTRKWGFFATEIGVGLILVTVNLFLVPMA